LKEKTKPVEKWTKNLFMAGPPKKVFLIGPFLVLVVLLSLRLSQVACQRRAVLLLFLDFP
jgi:hypothetical protein